MLAIPVLIGLGVWQLQRMEWKNALHATLAAEAAKPMLDLGAGPLPAGMQFRQVGLLVDCPKQTPGGKMGYSPDGVIGYSVMLHCRAGADELLVDAGWGPRPDSWANVPGLWRPPHKVTGMLIESEHARPRYTLVADDAPAPLVPSARPTLDTIPNNHLSYAIQWFTFAALLGLIWWLYVRRWRRGSTVKLASPPTED